MSGRLALSFDFHLGRAGAKDDARRAERGPLRVLMIGDFRGQAERPPLRERRPARVDVDNFDTRLSSLQPRVTLAPGIAGGEPCPLAFRALDDFHPDQLCGQVPLVAQLRSERARLAAPSTAAAACESIGRLLDAAGARAPAGTPQAPPAKADGCESDAATLARLLGSVPTRPAAVQDDAAARLVRAAVAPHVVAPEGAQVAAYRAALDELASTTLRHVLRDPGVRGLEAAWRALAWLVANVDGDDDVEWWMLDATKAELTSDLLGSGPDLSTTALHGLLVARERGQLGGAPWSLLLGDFFFGPSAADAQLLAALGVLAEACGGPFLAGAQPTLLGCAEALQLADPTRWTEPAGDAAEAWSALRQSSGARWLALALPRLLLRLPYGPRSDPIEAFAFEEVPDPRQPDAFVWGCPALAPTLLLARAFAEDGWGLDAYAARDIDGLPAYSHADDDGQTLLPCAEVLLPERAVQQLLQRGLVPLVSHRAMARIRVAGLPSLAAGGAPLAGAWAAEAP